MCSWPIYRYYYKLLSLPKLSTARASHRPEAICLPVEEQSISVIRLRPKGGERRAGSVGLASFMSGMQLAGQSTGLGAICITYASPILGRRVQLAAIALIGGPRRIHKRQSCPVRQTVRIAYPTLLREFPAIKFVHSGKLWLNFCEPPVIKSV